MTVVEYIQFCAKKYKLKYLEYDYAGKCGYRLTKSPTEYVEVYLRKDGTYGLHDRIGDCGSGGFEATVERVDSSLKRMGLISEVEQLTLF